MINWPVNLYLDLSPLEFFNFIFKKISSNNPKPPRLNDTNINVHT